jgi:SM-20-related protein
VVVAAAVAAAAAAEPQVDDAALGRLIDDLEQHGVAIVEHFLDAPTWHAAAARLDQLDAAGALVPAAVGRAAGKRHDPGVRGDSTAWLVSDRDPAESAVLAALDALRVALNRALFLGLADVEAHFACYPAGARYRRHRDRFRDDDARVVSVVLYLNDDWAATDGGMLRLFDPLDTERHTDVLPLGGRAVVFLSADIEHEVQAATRVRRSIAAWMRR